MTWDVIKLNDCYKEKVSTQEGVKTIFHISFVSPVKEHCQASSLKIATCHGLLD